MHIVFITLHEAQCETSKCHRQWAQKRTSLVVGLCQKFWLRMCVWLTCLLSLEFQTKLSFPFILRWFWWLCEWGMCRTHQISMSCSFAIVLFRWVRDRERITWDPFFASSRTLTWTSSYIFSALQRYRLNRHFSISILSFASNGARLFISFISRGHVLRRWCERG